MTIHRVVKIKCSETRWTCHLWKKPIIDDALWLRIRPESKTRGSKARGRRRRSTAHERMYTSISVFTIMKSVSFRNLRATMIPFMDYIMDNLSASDSASFMYAMCIRMSDRTMNRYLDVLRDIPEYEDWIHKMLGAGNKVMLVGSDLERLTSRIMHPQTYDRTDKRPICIWLMVLPTHKTAWEGMDSNEGLDLVTHASEDSTTAFDPCWEHYVDVEDYDLPYTAYYNRPEIEADYATGDHYKNTFLFDIDSVTGVPSIDEYGGWWISRLYNENGVRLAFFSNYNHSTMPSSHIRMLYNDDQSRWMKQISVMHYRTSMDDNPLSYPCWNLPLIKEVYTSDCADATKYRTLWYDVNRGVSGYANGFEGPFHPRAVGTSGTPVVLRAQRNNVTPLTHSYTFVIPAVEPDDEPSTYLP